MKRNLAIVSIAFWICGLICAGCSVSVPGTYFRYDHPENYLSGDGAADSVDGIEVDWIVGDIIIVQTSSNRVTFSESGEQGPKLHYAVEGNTLKIRFAGSGEKLPEGLKKDLTITVPERELREIDVESVSSDITFKGVSSSVLEASTVSGNIRLRECAFLEGDFETVSGDVELALPDRGFLCEFDTVSGRIDSEFSLSRQGEEYLYGDGTMKISVETVSGNLLLSQEGLPQEGGSQGSGSEGSGSQEGGSQGSGSQEGGSQGGSQEGGSQGGGSQEGGSQGGSQEGGSQGGSQEGGSQGGSQEGGSQGGSQGGKRYEFYENPSSYQKGAGSAANVHSVEIDWAEGEVSVLSSSSVSEITFSETDSSLPLCYRIQNGELKIKYAESGAYYGENFSKDLTVIVPADQMLYDLEIEGRADKIEAKEISVRELSLETLSGSIYAQGCSFWEGDFETVGGEIVLSFPQSVGFICEFETRSGSFSDEFGAVKRGKEYLYGNGQTEISVETVSGNLFLKIAK